MIKIKIYFHFFIQLYILLLQNKTKALHFSGNAYNTTFKIYASEIEKGLGVMLMGVL